MGKYEFTVAIQYDVTKGLLPVFTRKDGPNPFDIEEWPNIRQHLRENVLDDIPQEFEVYLQSDRIGERFEYTIGSIVVSEEGDLLQKQYDTSIDSLQEAFNNMD